MEFWKVVENSVGKASSLGFSLNSGEKRRTLYYETKPIVKWKFTHSGEILVGKFTKELEDIEFVFVVLPQTTEEEILLQLIVLAAYLKLKERMEKEGVSGLPRLSMFYFFGGDIDVEVDGNHITLSIDKEYRMTLYLMGDMGKCYVYPLGEVKFSSEGKVEKEPFEREIERVFRLVQTISTGGGEIPIPAKD